MASSKSDSSAASPARGGKPAAAHSIRQPVSCEPCRRRKIKCSRERAPCSTCRRRQCPESCIYLGTKDVPEPNRELLARIDNLEDMLRKHTEAAQSARPVDAPQDSHFSPVPAPVSRPLLSPPFESAQQTSFGLSPESLNLDVMSASSTASVYSRVNSGGQRGSLRSSANGNVQYEPHGAQWTAVLANTGITAPLLDDRKDDHESGFPFSSSAAPSFDDLLVLLPPMQQCDILKRQYFEVFSPLFHILHDPTFHAQYTEWSARPSSQSLSWLAILFVILSLAVTSLEETDPVLRDLARGSNPSENIRALSRRYREAAMKCLSRQGVIWGNHSLQSLQALIMLGYALSHSQEQTWPLLGMTYNVAIALGCHLDPSNFDINPIQSEERRRCWAGLIMLYTIQNVFLGNPEPSRSIASHSVQLPLDANDEDITATGVRQSAPGPTQVSYLLFKFKLYDLTSTICSEVFGREATSRQAISVLDEQICMAQESWDARYAADATNSQMPVSHKMHLHILHAYAHQLFLLLHRPFFAKSMIGLDVPNESQIRCIASAEALLDIHRLIHETPEYKPYLWYSNGLGSFHAFHAAVVLAVALLMPIYKPQYKRFRDILEDTAARFERLKTRSVICKRASKVLHFLLNTPSPNQPGYFNLPISNTQHSGHKGDSADDMDRMHWPTDTAEQLRFFAERLQPEQWLGPSSIAWNVWDDMLPVSMDGISA